MSAPNYRQARYSGVYLTGDTHTQCVRKDWKGDGSKRGVIVSHGTGGDDAGAYDLVGDSGTMAIVMALVAAGYPTACYNLGGSLWGNDTSIADFAAAFTHMTTVLGAKTDKVHLVGGSMGNASGMNWARANTSKVASITGLLPVSNVSDIVTNNRGSLASVVNAAYSGGWSEATYGATHNPVTYASSLSSLPVKLWYANDDTTVVPATVTALLTALGSNASGVNLGAVGGHTNASVLTVNPADVVAFVQANDS